MDHQRLHDFVRRASMAVGLPDAKASLLADLLTLNDLRGVFSHGTRQIAAYARLMRDGILNNHPEVELIRETPVSALVDGNGGLGYFAAHEGTRIVAKKALDTGIAVMVSRNHGHIGAAGIYARMPLEQNLLTYVTSGHQLKLEDGMPLYSAAGGSPMAFSAPGSEGPPLVVDFGCMHDLYANDPHRDDVAHLTPGLVLRSIGMGEICQSWGGFLAGLDLDADPEGSPWPGANQGALVICFRIDLFSDASVFKAKIDAYTNRIRRLKPIPPYAESYASGAVEAAREKEYRESGVPVGPEHLERLNELAVELGIDQV